MSILLILLSSRPASAETLTKADYRFQGTLSSSVGGAPNLANIGPGTNTFTSATIDGASTKVLSFPQGNGLKLSQTTSVFPRTTYTIAVLFRLDTVSGYRRIIDFKNGTSDNGLYVQDGKLYFYPHASGTGTPIAANTYVQVVLTRDSSGTVVGYVDGIPQFTFSDTSGDAVIDSSFDTLRFFRDNESGGVTTEHSSGSVARIRLYDRALSADEVGNLDRLEPTTFLVNSPADGIDIESRDGRCDVDPNTAGSQCTLRAALEQSAQTSGKDTIKFATGFSTINLVLGQQLPVDNDSDGYSQTISGPGASKLAVSANSASRVFYIYPGAVATISGLTIKNGFANGNSGGGIYNAGGTLTLNNSTISANTSDSFGTGGGGIYNAGGTLTLNNSTVSSNIANGQGGQGGGIQNESGVLTLNNSTISGNTANSFGGGGGGINNNGGTLTATNATISANNAPNGGGIFNNPNLANRTIIRNTIVEGNTAPGSPDAYGTFESHGFNLIGDVSGNGGWVGSDLLNFNPLLGPLQNNGGSTSTYALWPGSPAIDHANPTTPGSGSDSCPTTDQRGITFTRPKDGDQNGSVVCDIGAYERSDLTSPKVSSTTPASGAPGVTRNANLTATFSEKMTRSTLNTTTVKLYKVSSDGSTTQISSWTVSSSTDSLKATLNPFGTSSTLLEANTKYKAVVTTGARDLAGNQLDQDSTVVGNQQKEWTFTTGST